MEFMKCLAAGFLSQENLILHLLWKNCLRSEITSALKCFRKRESFYNKKSLTAISGINSLLVWYLRNRKHVLCFYRVIETRVKKVWENEKGCGNTSRRRVFPRHFRVLPNFHSCFYNSIGTRRTCFLFLLENTATKKKKSSLFTSFIEM